MNNEMQDLRNSIVDNFQVTTDIKVEWREMDAAGHVHNVQYFGYLETCRIAFFETLDFNVAPDNAIGVVVAKVDCKYIYPVTYPDIIIGGIRYVEHGEHHVGIEIHLFSKKYNRLVAISNQKLVFYHFGTKLKAEMPDDFLEKLEQL